MANHSLVFATKLECSRFWDTYDKSIDRLKNGLHFATIMKCPSGFALLEPNEYSKGINSCNLILAARQGLGWLRTVWDVGCKSRL
eukprot:1156437-Pelagomonas_calceolata.AAC.12